MKRVFRAVKERVPGGNVVQTFFLLECDHLASKFPDVNPIPRVMYCVKCSRTASGSESGVMQSL